MARFYFHLHNGVEAHDDEGRELPDLDAARDDACKDARDMAAESVRCGALDLRHYVEVADYSGAELFRVTFGEVVKITGFDARNRWRT
jgi:hypothetical protein